MDCISVLPAMVNRLLILATFCVSTVACQSVEPMKQSALDNGSFMGLWSTYSQCEQQRDFDQLRQYAVALNAAATRSQSRGSFVLPLPEKLEQYVVTPSARLAVDVKAMAAACSLRAGQAAVEANKPELARTLLKQILELNPVSDYIFYSTHAKALLLELEPAVVQVSLNRP